MMSRWPAGIVLPALLLSGCASAPCGQLDAAVDTSVPLARDGGVDAGPAPLDANVLPDGCVLLSPVALEIGPVRLAVTPNRTPACAEEYRYILYRPGETTPVGDSGFGIACSHGFSVPPGSYDLVIERTDDAAWYVGGAITRTRSRG